ncbi:hypothetical protein HB780_18575 [Rhizobium lusitanum]|uniref:hypothetical protein n=1 Tax=Rhizobium lusitanum TaxID=293958 RepID=UPI0016116969|nr:hypothetical protein [Rhizobium lusitanum]QND47681.1 hypothetical protein HB780_18575 [Rhizobium lusitanum]
MKSIFSKLFSLSKMVSPQVTHLETHADTAPSFAERAHAVAIHLGRAIHGLEVTVTQERPFVFTIRTSGVIQAKIQLLFGDLVADIDNVAVASHLRRQGLCRRFTQELYNAIRSIGLRKMTLYAVKDGCVTWAALGFRPTANAWKLNKAEIEKSFRAYRHEFPPEVAETISELIFADQTDVFPIIANSKIEGDIHLPPVDLSSKILGEIKGWHGEFDVESERYRQYLFR